MTDQSDTSGDAPRAPVPVIRLDATDTAAYDALRTGCVMFDVGPRHVSQFLGASAAAALNGLVTNDVTTLAVGRGQYAVALTPKGKTLADLAILRTEPETFLVETSAYAGAAWFAMVRKYVNPRLAKYVDLSPALAPIGVYGPHACRALAGLGGTTGGGAMLADALAEALAGWPIWASAAWNVDGNPTRLVRVPYLGAVPGFTLFVATDDAEAVRTRLAALGAVAGSAAVFDIAALETGRPLFGLDMDDATIPQEANLEGWSAISFEKGCYTGQETVARLHFRGHVNKRLCWLESASEIPVGPLFAADGKTVGDVRRSGVSPARGPIAVAMVRREVVGGAVVRVGGADGVEATVGEIVGEIADETADDEKRGAR